MQKYIERDDFNPEVYSNFIIKRSVPSYPERSLYDVYKDYTEAKTEIMIPDSHYTTRALYGVSKPHYGANGKIIAGGFEDLLGRIEDEGGEDA